MPMLWIVLISCGVCRSSLARTVGSEARRPASYVAFDNLFSTTQTPGHETVSDGLVMPPTVPSQMMVTTTASGNVGNLRPVPTTHKPHPGKRTETDLQPILRWLWWVVCLYFFWAQAHVCDEYFVPVIESISDRLQIPEDVAGATIMALGCNGPELFINSVGIYQGTDLGVGAVLGGSVFNLLVLIGCALLATPDGFMPLKISKFSFSRDCFFYAVSILLIWWVLSDQYVSFTNALVLVCGGIVYSSFVGLSASVRKACLKHADNNATLRTIRSMSVMSGAVNTTNESDVSPDGTSPESMKVVATTDEPATFQSVQVPEEGCFLGVRVQMANRMQDRYRHWDTRFVTLSRHGLVVNTAVRDKVPNKFGRTGRGIVFQRDSEGGGGHWIHGGLVNAPSQPNSHDIAALDVRPAGRQSSCPTDSRAHRMNIDRSAPGMISIVLTGESGESDASEVEVSEIPRANSDPEAHHTVVEQPSELIPFYDVVKCTTPLDAKLPYFELQVLQRASSMGTVITICFDAKTVESRDCWMLAIRTELQNVMTLKAGVNADASMDQLGMSVAGAVGGQHGGTGKRFNPCLEWLDWFRFPVCFLLRVTIPDVRDSRWSKCMPLAFFMSMAWLACFSYGVVEICAILSYEFGISEQLLGVTVAAIGTSFPNVISCVAVSKQGKTSMAIANALGANIQNVFIALAIPWFVNSLVVGNIWCTDESQPCGFKVTESQLDGAIFAMLGTLGMLVIVVIFAGCKMPKWAGWVFLIMYAVYFVQSLGAEFTNGSEGCPTFPFFCKW